MLTIRKPQLQALNEPKVQHFCERMLVHLKQCFPEECRMIGVGETIALVRHGIDRASHYGFCSQRDIALYINLIFVFGPNFDQNPDFPWAARILRDDSIFVSEKIERLYFAGTLHAHEGCGIST